MVDREMFAVCLFILKSVFVILAINCALVWCAYDGKYLDIDSFLSIFGPRSVLF